MRRALLILSGLVALALLAGALLPLGWVTARYVPGLEAESVSGSIWRGRIRGARYEGIPIGDVDAGLAFGPLLRGEAEIGWSRMERQRGDRLSGRASLSRGDQRLSGVTGTVALPMRVGGAAVVVGLDDVTVVTDRRGRCRMVAGRVSATVEGLPLIGALPPLSGVPACDGEAFHAPLGAGDGSVGLDLRLWPARGGMRGRWQADLSIRRQSPLIMGLLELAGFQRTADGVSISLAGVAGSA